MSPQNERLSEADTRAKLVTPALLRRGWKEGLISREETPGITTVTKFGEVVHHGGERLDYLLYLPTPEGDASPILVALVEAKKNTASPTAGMEQAKKYARLFGVRYAYSTNGYKFSEYDSTTGRQTMSKPMHAFPSPEDLRKRYHEECLANTPLTERIAKPLSIPYSKKNSQPRRYYQDAAMRRALEQIIRQHKEGKPGRVLLSLATGAGKTFIAVNLLKRIADAGGAFRALFLCDRDALRQQAHLHFYKLFGRDAEIVRRDGDENRATNARVHIATYQTLGASREGDDITSAEKFYPRDHFTHIVVDECHRSVRNEWADILADNPKAVHIGLTATPKQIPGASKEDREISSNNVAHFGEPVYAYGLAQGAEDGYLAQIEVIKSQVSIDPAGLKAGEVLAHNPTDYRTGKDVTEDELKNEYKKEDFEKILLLPDRVHEMCMDFFGNLVKNDTVLHKTIIFCVSQLHAEMVTGELNNIYAEFCAETERERVDPYAFVCTHHQGSERLADFRSEDNHHIIAATVDLLSTGVDIPAVRNIVFFRYMQSRIQLQQMVGRGARINEHINKYAFTVHDYTNTTDALYCEEWMPSLSRSGSKSSDKNKPPTALPVAEGVDVHIEGGRKFVIVADENGQQIQLDARQYRARLVQRLLKTAETLDDLREIWIDAAKRQELLYSLYSNDKVSLESLSELLDKEQCDGYDILAESAYGAQALTRAERANAFHHNNKEWLEQFPAKTQQVLIALVGLFEKDGVEELETDYAFDTPAVKQAGGIKALGETDVEPGKLLHEAKHRLFAA